MTTRNRWLFWGLLAVGFVAVGLVFLAFRENDEQLTGSTKQDLPMREWPRTKVVSGTKYWQVLESTLRTRTPGTVILPRETPGEEMGVTLPKPEKSLIPPQVCGECHRDHWNDCQQSAHFRTSSLATPESVRGHLDPPRNRVEAFHREAWLEVVAKPEGIFQELHIDQQGKHFHHEARIDLVIGSGKMGQSYLTWINDALHQLPLSHFSDADRWTFSPGIDYPAGSVNFARPVIERCLDCHATWFQAVPRTFNRYAREGFELGVTCSRCHGDGHEHVEHHKAHPEDSVPHRIVNPANLSRDLANAVCAQCHSGEGQLVSTGFRYQPGEPLSRYLRLPKGNAQGTPADPHAANQLQRIEQTGCFQKSEMSCFTCHDPHQNERGQEQLFVDRCLQCHQRDDCGQRQRSGDVIDRLCIECHMPLAQDMDLRRPGQGALPMPKMRDHRIQVWPTATISVLRRLANSPGEPSKTSPAERSD